ncbi:MazG nucleotide pyrophosphohydrolase domain-containing protein [Sphaerisporangium fuscum]|uniref:MazG nucleotide pyrophosphohydrolase domain-containing protein n=1 Tax=Sphaerisporangium fuscum TaxID=2835868 RepID=UPI001BDD2434|nr:MazG nucleotide pyrophosphohydrolase domain-containing protein [Sphaerisporangium fuscum]
MDLASLQARALVIKQLYDDLNLSRRGRVWTNEEFMLGFTGDVGDLAKLVMAAEGTRGDVGGSREALVHELADCLWSVLILAHAYDVDLAADFLSTMDELEQRIKAELETGQRPGSQARPE